MNALKYIAGLLYSNDKEVLTEDDRIENGSNTNGNYTKFPDGTLICWNYGCSVPDINSSIGTGGAYQSSADGTWTFPHAFAGTLPIVTGSRTGFTGVFIVSGTGGTSLTETSFRAAKLSAAYPSALSVQMQAIGRWK